MQRAFCKKFKLKRHDSVFLCVKISKWKKTFQETSTVISVRVVGKKRWVQMVENCEKLYVAVEAAPQTSLSLCFLLSMAD